MRVLCLLLSLGSCIPLLAMASAQPLHAQADHAPARIHDPHALPSSGLVATDVVLNRTVGLSVLDGELWGTSDRYKVRFDADGFEFTPALGASAPRNFPLTFRLESIGRGATQAPLLAAGRRHSGLRVEYDRGVAVERYDLAVEGMEQSFVFAERPAGSGDLVVRGRLQTDLLVTPDAGGLRLERPGIGGFEIGRVTGIDARGARADGSIRIDGDAIELSLPAEFVDRAALPLVLDPFVGGVFSVASTTALEGSPRAAFDVSNDCYLVVWEVVVSGSDRDIYGQRLLRRGAALGGRIAIAVNPTVDTQADVANVNGHNAFVVVYTRSGDILGRTVNAATGGVALATAIASGASNQHSPSVGGDSVPPITFPTGSVVCVWRSDGDQAVMTTRVTVNIDLSLTPSTTVHTLAQGTAFLPRISKSGGGPRRYAVVYERRTGVKSVWGIVVDSGGAPITAEQNVAPGFGGNVALPSVDGDGSNWVAAFESEQFRSVYASSFRFDVHGRRLVWTSICISNGSDYSLAIHPSVLWTGGSALVGWHGNLAAGGFGAALFALEPFHCSSCEGVFPLGGTHPLNGEVEGCSALSGGGPADDALVVWEGLTASTSDIVARLWRSADGVVTSLGGGCGPGGTAHVGCGRADNSFLERYLRSSSPNAPAILVLSAAQSPVSCGTCRLIPSLASAITLFLPTNAAGDARLGVRFSDPGLRGATLFEQWLTARPGGACTPFDLDMSNALQVVIE